MSALAILTKCPLAKCRLAKCPLAKCLDTVREAADLIGLVSVSGGGGGGWVVLIGWHCAN